MNEAPEGLDYGTTNMAHKYDRTPCNDQYKELGKIETGRHPSYSEIYKAAEALRSKGDGSHDPHYSNSKKNK